MTSAAHASPAPSPRLELVLALEADDEATALECAEVLVSELRERYAARPRAVLRIAPGRRAVEALPGLGRPVASSPRGDDPVAAVLAAARALGGCGVALVGTRPGDDARCLRHLLAPVVEGQCDVVAACYAGRRLDGALQSGIAYPLTRAVFGTRLRQPFTRELALSARAVEHLVAGGAWLDEIAGVGPDLWVASPALTGALRVGQVWLESRPAAPRAVLGEDPSATLSRTMTLLFRAMERHVEAWQRGGRGTPVTTFRALPPAPGRDAVDTAALLETFRVAARELGRVWAGVLSPATSLALQRAANAPAQEFRLPDDVWARTVYDCALAWRARAIARPQLVGLMTPLYFGWLAGFAGDVLDGAAERVEERVETLCLEFEHFKRDLVARWRWPDPFVP